MNSEGLGICACEQQQTGKTYPKKCSREAPGDGGRKVGNRWRWQRAGRQMLLLSLQRLQKSCFNCPSGQELKSDPKNSLNVDGVMSGKD